MNDSRAILVEATQRLTNALRNETEIARAGSISDLGAAALAKQSAFGAFLEARSARDRTLPPTDDERAELRRLFSEANENAIILEAVMSTVRNFIGKLRSAVTTISDPGTYNLAPRPRDRVRRHLVAACINARV
jgi:hypothetical protein